MGKKFTDRSEIEPFLHDALGMIDRCRRVLRRHSGRAPRAARKTDRTLVSEVDREIETSVRQFVQARHPDHGVVGEEFPEVRDDAEWVWFVDPIDGTEDFLRGIPTYGTIIGLWRRDRPVLGVIDLPALDLCCHAALGTGTFVNGERVRIDARSVPTDGNPVVAIPALEDFRKADDDTAQFVRMCSEFPNFRTFRTCYAHVLAVTGGVDAAVEYAVARWDLAASRILIEEAGGEYASLPRRPSAATRGAVLGHPDVVGRLAELLV